MFSPWLFHPEYGVQAQGVARAIIAERLSYIDRHLAEKGPFLLGEDFTVADAYLFAILSWSSFGKVDFSRFSTLRDYIARISARPAVQSAMGAEGLTVAS